MIADMETVKEKRRFMTVIPHGSELKSFQQSPNLAVLYCASINPKASLPSEVTPLNNILDSKVIALPLHFAGLVGVKELEAPKFLSSRPIIPKAALIAPKVAINELS